MKMDIHTEALAVATGPREFDRLQGELEQARVALEDMDHRVTELTAANADLQARLAEETRRREFAEEQLRQLTAAAGGTAPAEDITLRQQLSTALEELHVMAEELSTAQDALRRAAISS